MNLFSAKVNEVENPLTCQPAISVEEAWKTANRKTPQ